MGNGQWFLIVVVIPFIGQTKKRRALTSLPSRPTKATKGNSGGKNRQSTMNVHLRKVNKEIPNQKESSNEEGEIPCV